MAVRRSRGAGGQKFFYDPLYNTLDDEIEHCDLMTIPETTIINIEMCMF